jgi:hypothetical protein
VSLAAHAAAARERSYDGMLDRPVLRPLAEEVPVAIEVNGVAYAVMMASASDLEDFAAGFALSEGFIAAAEELAEVIVAAQPGGAHLVDDLISPQHPRPIEPCPAAAGAIIVPAERPGPPCAGEGQALLSGDEGMIGDPPDGLGTPIGEHRRDIARHQRPPALAVDLNQRLEPVHAPARDAFDGAARSGKGRGNSVSSAGE